MVLQRRDLHLLRELTTLRVADRELVKVIAGFGSTTRTNVRLLALVRAGFLRRFSLGHRGASQKLLYTVSRKGAQLVGVPYRGPRRRIGEPVIADAFIDHQLAINAVYRTVKYQPTPGLSCVRWLTFLEPITTTSRLIPDGYFELKTMAGKNIAAFVEVDLANEHLPIWKRKAESYVHLAVSGDFEHRFGQDRFRVLVLVNSERRMQFLRKTIASVTDRVFWFTTMEAFGRDGLLGRIWLRPLGDGRHLLIKTMS